MIILGIETSCDETAATILEGNSDGSFRILAEEISSQAEIHVPYGGVVPELASREHLKNLPIIVDAVLEKSSITLDTVSLIGVTRGPGLKGCLLVGLNFAKALSLSRSIPLVGVNHIEGHVLSPFLENPELQFPYLSLVASGGHTEIAKVLDVGKYEVISRTIDDAAGEAFDKSAHLLGFEYPGGAKLSMLAESYGKSDLKLPRVMREAEGFSFSGLKTAVSLLVKKHESELERGDEQVRGSIASAIQEAIVDALLYKLKRAVDETGIRRVSVTGGVSANKRLRSEVRSLSKVDSFFPSSFHATDNASMIAFTAWKRHVRGENTDLSCDVLSRWPVELMELR